jgi:hypothetical protein
MCPIVIIDANNRRSEMTLTLEKLKAAFKKNENEGTSRPNNYYPFWNIPDGSQAIVRFLPDANKDNPMGFMVEKLMHTLTINGENKSVPCLKMYGEECPICKVSSAFYKEDDKVNGKKYWRKKQHLAQVLVVEDPLPPDETTGETHEGKVRFVALGFQLFNIIKDAFESGELDEVPFAFEGGTNFIIKKTKQGDYPSYALSKFARRSTDLSDDEIASVRDQMVDLSTLIPQSLGVEKVESMLEAALTGATYGEDDAVNFTSVQKKVAPARVTEDKDEDLPFEPDEKLVTRKAAKVVEEDSSDEDLDDEADRILQQIRARQKAKAS